MQQARLIFENGWEVTGESVGAAGRTVGRLVPHTDMTGYQELLSDPACRGQLVCMTYPLIGNVGVSESFNSSGRIQPRGLVFREAQPLYSNWMGERSFTEWISEAGVVAASGMDTREIMRRLRVEGGMNAVLTTFPDDRTETMAALARSAATGGELDILSSGAPRILDPLAEAEFEVCVIDLGMRQDFADYLRARGARLTILPYRTSAESILARRPSGVMVSPGPAFSDEEIAPTIRALRELAGKVPLLGVGSGFTALAMAYGWQPTAMAHGHHGANHPVRDEHSGRTFITHQNHWIGFESGARPPDPAQAITYRNVNDQSIEGVRFAEGSSGVQFTPDDHLEDYGTGYIWEEFLTAMQRSV
ncbi:MAG: carbamoyl phosphate synthase small subunit [Clostridia bacterium]|nr:carbamoyl phosphate synthase small subunit [Clostridia bacterium]